jgi:hypothetical protein
MMEDGKDEIPTPYPVIRFLLAGFAPLLDNAVRAVTAFKLGSSDEAIP